MPSRLHCAKRWRDHAEETLAIAEQMRDPECKRILLDIALAYAELARVAQAYQRAKAESAR
jgi:hypothetical protein